MAPRFLFWELRLRYQNWEYIYFYVDPPELNVPTERQGIQAIAAPPTSWSDLPRGHYGRRAGKVWPVGKEGGEVME